MAKLRSSSQISQFSQVSNPNLCSSLLVFIFLITLLLQSSTSMARASPPTAQPPSTNESSRSSTSTMVFHPKSDHHGSDSKSTRSFESGAHEVPSGPNPISNR
ncbi:hypothetical protein SSX86_013143 [Deinandra increscens subsp. villosa]|uniref:Uncharacterized protein n=1 Tax=Deinandra increscens subsp. villosa TaxID=3103831 RepID=A0AAP0H256_9ASTR